MSPINIMLCFIIFVLLIVVALFWKLKNMKYKIFQIAKN